MARVISAEADDGPLSFEEEEELGQIRGMLVKAATEERPPFTPKLSSRSQKLAQNKGDGASVWKRINGGASGQRKGGQGACHV